MSLQGVALPTWTAETTAKAKSNAGWIALAVIVVLGCIAVIAVLALKPWEWNKEPEKPAAANNKNPPNTASAPPPPPAPSKTLNTSNPCATTSDVNLVRNSTFSLPAIGGDVEYGNVVYWEPSTGVDHRLGVVKSEANTFFRVRAPGSERQYLIMQTDGAAISQRVTGFKVGCMYYLNLLVVSVPGLVTGMLSVYLDDSTVLMPETYSPSTSTPSAFVKYGPFEFAATKTIHQIRLVLTGSRAQGPLLCTLVGNVSITSSKSPALPNPSSN